MSNQRQLDLRTSERVEHFRQTLRTQWFLLPTERDALNKHYLLRWTTQFIQQRLVKKPNEPIQLEHDGTKYQVEFKDANIGLCLAADYCFLSFRKAMDGYAVVIIKPMWHNKDVRKRI